MASIEPVLAMLLAIVSGYLVRTIPFALPLPIVQIVLGGVIAGVLHHGVMLQPAVFFQLFLPPLLFLDGWRIPKDGLLRDKGTILQLALGFVVFTVIGAGYMIHLMIPAMPLAVAFALAAMVSPTDPVAVSSIASRAPVPRWMMHILEGESLLNDASGLVCFQFAVAAALTGTLSPGSAALTFLWVALAGLGCGVAFTALVAFVQQWLTRRFGEAGGSPILVNLLIPFGAYLIAERVHARRSRQAIGSNSRRRTDTGKVSRSSSAPCGPAKYSCRSTTATVCRAANQHTLYARDAVSQQPHLKSSPVAVRRLSFGQPEPWLLERLKELDGTSIVPFAARELGGTVNRVPAQAG